jgi:hypothetical protein
MLIATIGVGLWCLLWLSDTRNVLFILCLFLSSGSAASCLYHLLYLLFVGQSAQDDISLIGTLITVTALWKPLHYVIGKLTISLLSTRQSGKSRLGRAAKNSTRYCTKISGTEWPILTL